MRRWVMLIAAIPAVGLGQVPTNALRAAILKGVADGLIKFPKQTVPTEATGFPVKPGDPEPEAPPGPNRFRLQNADYTRKDRNKILARGNVRFGMRGYTVFADEVVGDLDTEEFELTGNVIIDGLGKHVVGQKVIVNFKKKTFIYEEAKSEIKPSALGGNFKTSLFLRGGQGGGTERQFLTYDTAATTCDIVGPHFEILAASTDIKPGKRVIFRKVKLKILDRTVLSLPYLILPLTQESDRYIPEFGKSSEEGYFVKSKFGIPLRGSNWIDQRIDYFTKLGAGIGQDWHYYGTDREGLVRGYLITGQRKTQLLSLDHRDKLFGGALNVAGLFQNNNYLQSSDQRNYSLRSDYTLASKQGSSRLSFQRTSSKSATFGSVQQNWSLSDNRRWTDRLNTSLDMNLTQSRSSSGGTTNSDRKQLDVRFKGSDELARGTASLEYQRSIPVGQNVGFFGSGDRTPVFSFASDSRRLLGGKTDRFPFRAEYSLGEFTDGTSRKRLSRNSLDFLFSNQLRSGSRMRYGYNSRFKQGLYSNDTAQYSLANNFTFGYDFGNKSTWNVRYDYLRPHGFTPLNIDRSGRNHEVSTDVSYLVLPSLSLGAQSSYSIYQPNTNVARWQTLGVRSDWNPNDKFFLRSDANYDPTGQVWSNLRFDLGWKTSKGTISAGTRYDGTRHTWGSANLIAEGLTYGKLKTSILLSFNGYSRRFEARHFSFIYDLHDAEAIMQIIDNPTGFRSGTSVQFFIRLKALPFDTPFGIGQKGQAIGTGGGVRR